MEGQVENNPEAKRRSGRRGVLYGVLGAAAVAMFIAARPIAAAVQGRGLHGAAHGLWGRHGGNPEAMREHIQVAVKWALREIDASEDQQQKVSGILTSAADDLVALKERHRANREAFAAGLGGATVDRAALEEVRKSELALAEEASRRLVQAMADAAEALTPEQRQALIEHAHRAHH